MLKQIHLQDGLFRRHGLEREALGADDFELFVLLFLFHGSILYFEFVVNSAFAQLLLQTGFVFADLANDQRTGGVERGVHVVGEFAGTVEHTVVVERNFNTAAAALGAERDGSFAVLLEELIQLTNFLFGVGLDFGIDLQLLFDKSYEFGECEGLGLIPGEIHPLRNDISAELKVPQMGWNPLKIIKDDPLLDGIDEGDCVYFVHSFYAKHCEENLCAVAEYGVDVPALVRKNNVWGAQFHPEKSGDVGLRILKNFIEG